jgi:Protein of unknown function (DUF3040)
MCGWGEVGLLHCLCARSRWNAELGEPRQLEQIEQALRADDPRFASAVHAADPRVRYKRRGTEAALGFLIGVGLLLAGVVINVNPDRSGGLCGHACLQHVGGDQLPAHDRHHRARPAKDRRSGKKRRAAKARRSGKQAGSGLMGRLEERWRHRQQGGR